MRGTWQTTDSGGGWKAALLAIGAVLLLGSGGAVAAVSEALIGALLAAVVVTALSVVALAAFLVHRARNPSPEGFVRMGAVRMPVVQQLPGERPAIEQHVHFHFDGADPAAVAEILRRSQRPEQ
jgi:membrane protein implicated in regulation of membrane protease activity